MGRDFPSGSSDLACDGAMGGAMKNYIQRRELLKIPRIKNDCRRGEGSSIEERIWVSDFKQSSWRKRMKKRH